MPACVAAYFPQILKRVFVFALINKVREHHDMVLHIMVQRSVSLVGVFHNLQLVLVGPELQFKYFLQFCIIHRMMGSFLLYLTPIGIIFRVFCIITILNSYFKYFIFI